MSTILVNRFDGIADSPYSQTIGQFSIAKHFDVTTLPGRLSPYRGMAVDTSGQTAVGNLLVGSDGLIYGLGDAGTNQTIYKKPDNASAWTAVGNSTSGFAATYNLFLEYKNWFYAARTGYVMRFDRTAVGSSSTTFQAVSWTNIGQGIVHPKDDILYIPYDNFIYAQNGHAGTPNITALTLPSYLTITSIAAYGNYLAIAATPTSGLSGSAAGGGFKSTVYLWDRDATLSTVSESIDWGTGVLRVLNTLDGVLVGISDSGGESANIQDRDSIVIKGYAGGTPFLIKEVSTIKQTSTFPDAAINPRVNFLYRNKLHFSINVVGGSTSPKYYGVWTLGKSKASGQYAVTLERVATNANTETGVLACAITGDYASMVHTAAGTLTFSINSSAIADSYQATSVYESIVNPDMPLSDGYKKKQLKAVSCHYLPLPSVGSVITNFISMYYRVDGGSWTKIFDEATPGAVVTEMVLDASGTQFTSGRNYEFKIESTGSAEILGFCYKYDLLQTAL